MDIGIFEGMPVGMTLSILFSMLTLAYTDTDTANGDSMKKLPPFFSRLGWVSPTRTPTAIPWATAANWADHHG